MKSAYELAMERLRKQDPGTAKPLTDEQKKQIAEIDGLYKAKIAERELDLKPKLEKARFGGEEAAIETLEKQLREEVQKLREEMERAKEKVRTGG